MNPFTQVYNALWSVMESWPPFADSVKVGNRIKFGGKIREIIKQEVASSDLPEVRLVVEDATPHLQRTSNSTSVLMTLQWQVFTGDQRLDAILFPLKWEMLRAMSTWEAVLGALTWNDAVFAKLYRAGLAADDVLQIDLARGIKGWATIWSCTVELWFRTLDLQNKELIT